MTLLLPGVVAGASTLVLTQLVRRYAERRKIIDYPNPRSSHNVPTPRGGGLSIALVILAGTVVLATIGHLDREIAIGLVGGGGLVALIGWLDDHRPLGPWLRLGIQTGAALWAVYWQGGMPELRLGSSLLEPGLGGSLLAVLAIVWLTNLYNFMDGIDGLAAGQAMIAAAGTGWLLSLSGQAGLAETAFLVAGAAAGFLVWNWSPARIFMGDVGSGLLGFLFGYLAVASENNGGVPALAILLLLGTFIFDATVTLIRRMAGRERWYAAHRSHAYQRAVQAGWSHRRVTSALLAIGVLLGVFAWIGSSYPAWFSLLVMASTAILAFLYYEVERMRPMVTTRNREVV